MTKAEFLELVTSEWSRLDVTVAALAADGRLGAAFEDGRTGADVLAHLTWYESQMIGVLRERALAGSDLWSVSQKERNAAIHEANRSRGADEVLGEYHRVHAELLGLLENLGEEELHEAARFRDMPSDWPPWEMFADNTYKHYAGHLEELEELAGAGADGSRMVRNVEVRRSRSDGDHALAATLFREYAGSLDFALDFQDFDGEIERFPGVYSAPRGCVLLGFVDGELAGCVAMRPLENATCEMKRLFVRPGYRGDGLGRALALAIVRAAGEARYKTMRLDTVASMVEANRLYASLGFEEIEPYYRNPLPDAVFFELSL